VQVYRVFPWNLIARSDELGGPLYVARFKQGQGRHDIPDLDGVLYCSLRATSAVCEFLQAFRGQTLTPAHFVRPDGLFISLVEFRLHASARLIDLDDPGVLTKMKIRPSEVLTRNRDVTRNIAERIYRDANDGLLWPSAIEASWTNITLFASRIRGKLIVSQIRKLTVGLPEVIEAAKLLGISTQ
jgi:hypothetical protein